MATREINVSASTKGASVKAKKNLAHTTMKRIKITSNGPLATKGGVRGPVLRPYMETIINIRHMIIRDKATIIEILNDGTELALTVENYMLDNNAAPVETKKTPAQKSDKKVEETKKEEQPVATVEPEVVEETVTEETTEEESTGYDYSNKKKNKKNR